MVRYLYLRVAGALVLIGCLFLGPTVAWAHEQVDSGNYHFEIGWVNEPVLVGERNGLDLFVAAKDSPETGLSDLESNLTFAVEYGSARQEYDVVPVEDNPGHYTAAFVPTREGQYTFHLTGTIQNQAIDVQVEPEEVVAAGQLAFPEALPSAAELAAKLDGAQAQAGTAQTIAIVGAALGLIGAGLGAFGLLRKK